MVRSLVAHVDKLDHAFGQLNGLIPVLEWHDFASIERFGMDYLSVAVEYPNLNYEYHRLSRR